MASVYAHPKSGIFHVSFRYEGIQYGKSLRTRNRRKADELAKATQRAVNELKSGRDKEGLKLLRRGFKVLDAVFPTAEVRRYIEEGERIPATLRDLHDRWIEHLKNEGRADTTVDSAKHRLVHSLRHFGDEFRVDHLSRRDLDQYVGERRKVDIAEYTIVHIKGSATRQFQQRHTARQPTPCHEQHLRLSAFAANASSAACSAITIARLRNG